MKTNFGSNKLDVAIRVHIIHTFLLLSICYSNVYFVNNLMSVLSEHTHSLLRNTHLKPSLIYMLSVPISLLYLIMRDSPRHTAITGRFVVLYRYRNIFYNT